MERSNFFMSDTDTATLSSVLLDDLDPEILTSIAPIPILSIRSSQP